MIAPQQTRILGLPGVNRALLAAYVPRRKTIMPMRAMSTSIAAVSSGLAAATVWALRSELRGKSTVVSFFLPPPSL